MAKFHCRICLRLENARNCVNISPNLESSSELLAMLTYCVPEMDINIVRRPMICKPCIKTLTTSFSFKKQCLSNEEKFLKFIDKYSVDSNIDIEEFCKTVPTSIYNNNLVNVKDKNRSVVTLQSQRIIRRKTKYANYLQDGCVGCTSKFKDPKYHTKVQSDVFICFVCSKHYYEIQTLRKHVYGHTRRYLCQICGKGNRDIGQLEVHLRVHSGEKPFKCPVCGKQYKQKFALTEHMYMHENRNNNKNQCKLCNKSLSSTFNLKIHMQQHKTIEKKSLKEQESQQSTKESDINYENVLEDIKSESESDTFVEVKEEIAEYIFPGFEEVLVTNVVPKNENEEDLTIDIID